MKSLVLAVAVTLGATAAAQADGLWDVYDDAFAHARYIDLTHVIAPGIPVWKGFGPSIAAPATNPATGKPYTWRADGFEATHYNLATDQLGT